MKFEFLKRKKEAKQKKAEEMKKTVEAYAVIQKEIISFVPGLTQNTEVKYAYLLIHKEIFRRISILEERLK